MAKQTPPSFDELWDSEPTPSVKSDDFDKLWDDPVKKKEPTTEDLQTPAKPSGASGSIQNDAKTNEIGLPKRENTQVNAKQQTYAKSDSEIQAEKRAAIPKNKAGANLADWNNQRIQEGKTASSTGQLTPDMQAAKAVAEKAKAVEKQGAKARSYIAEKDPWTTLIESGAKYITEDLPEMAKIGASIMAQPTYSTPYGIPVTDKEYEKNPLRWESDKTKNIANVVTDYLSKKDENPPKEYIDQISEVQDGLDFINYAASTVGKAVPQIGAQIASGGLSSYVESAGNNYISQIQKKSQDTGRSARDIIESGDDDKEAAQATALVVAGLDKIGLGKMLKGASSNILKKKVATSFGQKLLNAPKQFAKGAAPEMGTEGLQTVSENVGSDMASGRELSVSGATEGLADALIQGGGIGGSVRAGSSLIGSKNIENEGVQIQEQVERASAVTGGAQSSNDSSQQQKSTIQSAGTEVDKRVSTPLEIIESRDPEAVVQTLLRDPLAALEQRLNINKDVPVDTSKESAITAIEESPVSGEAKPEITESVLPVSDLSTQAGKTDEEGVQNSVETQQVEVGSKALTGDTKNTDSQDLKESKFNIRQRLGIPVNDAIARLADNDRLTYKVLKNSTLLAEADAEIAKDIDAAFQSVVSEDSKVSELAMVFAKAGRLIGIFEDAIRNSEDSQTKEFLTEKLDQIRTSTQKKATAGGQAVQALSTVGNILPERDQVVLSIIAQREASINKDLAKTIESDVKKDVSKDVESTIDGLVANDPAVKKLEAKIAELEAKIAAGKTANRKAAVKKAVDKLDSLINNNLAFSDATGAVAITKQGLIVAREAIKAGDKVIDAIEKAVRYINAKSGGKWDEKAFREAVENSLADVREDLDALYDEKKSLQESKKKLKSDIRIGLQSGDFSGLEAHLIEKGMPAEDVDTYVSDLRDKHEKAVIVAVSKRIDKNLGVTPKKKSERSLAYIEANSEPLTDAEKTAKLESKKEDLDKKIQQERSKRISKNLETTKEKQLRTEREKLERDLKEKTTSQIARKIANSEPLTDAEKTALLKKKNNLEDITGSEQERLKELYDEVERVYTDPDLRMEAINNLRHEAQKLIPKTRLMSWLSYYDSNIYYPNILSSPWTSALNLKDAFFNTIDLVPQMRKGGLEAYKDQAKGLKQGAIKAKIGLSEGFINQGILNNAEFDKLDLSRKTSEDYAKEGHKIAKFYSKWVGRIMALPNTLGEATKFSTLSFIIQKDLKSQGLSGRELIDKKNELLYGTQTKKEEFAPEATRLVYGTENPKERSAVNEAKVQRTISNMILSDMQSQMTTKEGQEAVDIANHLKDKATHQQSATGVLGLLPLAEKSLPKVLQVLVRKFGGFEFLNTSMNVANNALEYTPYGYARGNDKSVSRGIDAVIEWFGYKDAIKNSVGLSEGKTSEEKARIIQKSNAGSAILATTLLTTIALAVDDEDEEGKNRLITGSLKPVDYLNQKTKFQHEKEANLAVPAYSINLPGIGWWNYSGTPLQGVLSIAGNTSDYLYAKKSKGLTETEIAKGIIFGSAQSLKSTLIDGTPIGAQLERNRVSKNTDAENTQEWLTEWAAHKTANMTSAMTPNLIKSMAKEFDPTNYTPKEFPAMVAKATGILNAYSALGFDPKVPYAVDLLGNKISSKSGEKYFNTQKGSVSKEDEPLYDLLLSVYKEPSNYPSYLSPKTSVGIDLMKKEDYDAKLKSIERLYKRGAITQVQMTNRVSALEKEAHKIDDIGNNPLMYTKALEYCGKYFKEGLKSKYEPIMKMNDQGRIDAVNDILMDAKEMTTQEFSSE